MRKRKSKQCSACKNYVGKCWSSDDSQCVRFLPLTDTNFTKIDGFVETPPNIDMDAFSQLFINWIESLGYVFIGGFSPESNETDELG